MSGGPSSPVLTLQNLRVQAPDSKPLLRGVSLSVAPGVPLTVLGETGSGKTLVVDAVMGTLAPGLRATGHVMVDGVQADAGDAAARRHLWGRRLALLPQEPWLALDPTMRALPQVEESHALVRNTQPVDARVAGQADLAALGIDKDAQRRFPCQLSGGMAQRVAIAAARAGGASILLADEPTKGLDAGRRDAVVEALRVALGEGGALLCITHDVAVARALGGEVAVMLDGAVVEHGPADRVLSYPEHAYTRRLLAAEPSAWPEAERLAPGATVIEAENLTVSVGDRTLFSGLDLRLGAGEWVSVTGPSGCGKSTLGNVLLGLRRPDSGRVRRAAGSATRFGKLYQDPVATFAPHRTLRTALAEVAALHRVPWVQAGALMEKLRVANALLDRLPDAVSGGELQRIAIIRALLPGPVFLFADEPTSRLDPITQRDTLDALKIATAERGCAVLLVTHDPALAAKMAGRGFSLGQDAP